MRSVDLKRLTKEELDKYDEDGFICVSGIFTDQELEEIRQEYDQLFQRKKMENGRLEARWAGDWEKKDEKEKDETEKNIVEIENEKKKSVLSIHNLQQHSAVFTRLILHKGLLDVMEDIVGDGLVLHHTKAHLKPGKQGAAFPSHQDYHYFPYRDHSMIAAFVHLEDTTAENGGLGVFPGSQRKGAQENVSTNPGVYYLNQEEWNIGLAKEVKAKAGDVVIFSYLLVHASYPNISDIPRRMFLLQVAGSNDVPVSNQHVSPGSGLMLRGRSYITPADLDMRHLDQN
ncbi:uncharacterized protein LOC111706475 [Eurytemora carolleeae]|uniref:uncharacterized protein LOC111706475 n=1 Tax=Eurytemora carolleeae TaxID=1294199 RepID=UPI000C78EE15|nr:uncharacterized protein LOC111706475 [Eurytemora carolleeae]|eukprot:XP_023335125.1 uncharacterized protein LOC111706475 [Eurytemora affinis]